MCISSSFCDVHQKYNLLFYSVVSIIHHSSIVFSFFVSHILLHFWLVKAVLVLPNVSIWQFKTGSLTPFPLASKHCQGAEECYQNKLKSFSIRPLVCNCAVWQLAHAGQLSVETRLSVTGAELKQQILTAVSYHGDHVNISNMKLITSGHVIDDNVSLLQQQQIRVCYSCYLYIVYVATGWHRKNWNIFICFKYLLNLAVICIELAWIKVK